MSKPTKPQPAASAPDPIGDSIRAVLGDADTRPGTFTLNNGKAGYVRVRDETAPAAAPAEEGA